MGGGTGRRRIDMAQQHHHTHLHGGQSHGNSPAAWTAVTIIIIGAIVAGIAVVMSNWVLFGVGAVGIPLVGLLVGRIMASVGLGGRPNVRHPREEVESSAEAA
jgi:hypothetical protein